jgi:hypothetical protein
MTVVVGDIIKLDTIEALVWTAIVKAARIGPVTLPTIVQWTGLSAITVLAGLEVLQAHHLIRVDDEGYVPRGRPMATIPE